jgi:hypothetical protein
LTRWWVAEFNLKEAVAATQRRKGAKSQGSGFRGSFIRWVSVSSPSFPSHLPALGGFASWRPPSAVLLRRTGLCVNCLSWVQPVEGRRDDLVGWLVLRLAKAGKCP